MMLFSTHLLLLLLLLLVATGQSPAPPSDGTSAPKEPSCVDRGKSGERAESVVAGEVGWLSCPLFSHSSADNSTESTGRTPAWYRLLPGHHLEPIELSWRLSRDRDRLWLQPASAADAGVYICVLRNSTSCSRISMVLTVLPSGRTIGDDKCSAPEFAPTRQVIVRLQEGVVLNCTDLEDATKMADGKPNVTWFYMDPSNLKCEHAPFWNPDREQRGEHLRVHIMQSSFEGFYFCSVRYQRRGQLLNFTRRLNVTTAYPSPVSKHPSILQLFQDKAFPVRQSSEVRLVCKGLFPFLESSRWAIWWTVDGQTLDKLPDHQRFYNINKLLNMDHYDRKEESVLVIRNFQPGDLDREFNCSVRNARGFLTRRAELHEEARLPSVELGCGLGATLLLMLLLFVVYHIFWLELLLLYRSWFGTDEQLSDDKEYDVYISYARNSEEEHFVLSTLRSVLENELGYSVCIFDRDSLPGGTITDETLSFVARSRRLLVVVSPGYASQGSQALLELKAGLDGMARGGHLRVILIQYKPVQRRGWVKELRRARVALALVRWRGDESRELTSRFWKRLRVELPVRRQSSREEAVLMRLHSQNSTCSQTGLLSNSCS